MVVRLGVVDCVGGMVYLFFVQDVFWFESEGGVVGVFYVDGVCLICIVWLYENCFLFRGFILFEVQEVGIYCYLENEVIFVVDGQICFGVKLFGLGIVFVIVVGVMYGFMFGFEGLYFLNFCVEQLIDILFKNGQVMDEVVYWCEWVLLFSFF